MIYYMVVYLFKHRRLSQLGDILQVTDRSAVPRRSSPILFNRESTSAHFQSSANNLDSRDTLIIFVMIGKNTSIQSITRDVGIGSKLQLFLALRLLS